MTTRLELGWQEDRPLSFCIGVLLETSMLTDVVFKVGETKVESIQAHRNILVCRSPVFEAMFCGDIKESNKKPIRIEDIEPRTFRELLTYIYTDKIELTKENAIYLLYAARKYLMRSLEKRCAEFVTESIKVSTVCTIFSQTIRFHDDELSELCLDFIQDNTKAVLADADFLALSNEGLCVVLDQDHLEECDESVLFRQCVRWARHKLADMGLSESEAQMREVLGRALFLLRFPSFTIREFGEICGKSNILNAEEKVAIFNWMAKGADKERVDDVVGFPTEPRHLEEPCTVDRFPKVLPGWGYGDGELDAVEVCVDQRIQLVGVAVFGPTLPGTVDVRLEVTDDTSGTLLASYATQHIRCNGTDNPVVVKFDSAVMLYPESTYTLSTCINSPFSATTYYSGSGGISSLVTADGCSFTFNDSARRTRQTETVAGRGQIAQLLYKKK